MITNRLFMAIAFCLSLVFSSCSKEQSELSLGSIEGTATAYGEITYLSEEYVTNPENDVYAALMNATIYVDVDLSQYDNGAYGVKRYTTTTDSFGNFSISIPCSVSMETVKMIVKVPSFTATYTYMFDKLSVDYSAVYEGGSAGKEFTLYSGDQKICDITLTGPTSTTAK